VFIAIKNAADQDQRPCKGWKRRDGSVQVLGNVKSAGSAIVSIMIFQNPVSLYGCLGFGIAILGSTWYAQSHRSGHEASCMHNGAGKSLERGAEPIELGSARASAKKEQ
jgi:hypothetical protein